MIKIMYKILISIIAGGFLHMSYSETMNLKDGRILGYTVNGPQDGIPVFHFHGSGGSRLEFPQDLSILQRLNVTYISVDRPGHGYSDYQKNRKLIDWPNDVEQLASHLKIDRFYVLGWSAGGPYALACAYKLIKKVFGGAIVSGFAPPNRPKAGNGYGIFAKTYMFCAKYFHPFIFILRKMSHSQVTSGKDIPIDCMLEPDKKIMSKKVNYSLYTNDVREGYRQGWKGVALDDILINNKWQFELSNITTHFDIWQGTKDQNVPFCHGHYQHNALPNSELHLIEGEGHMYLLNNWEKVLKTLVQK